MFQAMASVLEAPPAEVAAANGFNGHAAHSQPRDKDLPITICVGDLHGHVTRAKKLWENLKARVGPEKFDTCTVIFLGDYCDRGPDTRRLIDWLLTLKSAHPNQKQVFLAGNHDFSFAAFAGCLPPLPDDFDVRSTWQPLLKEQEREGWYSGPGHENMHVQGRRWAGVIKEKMSKKGRPYDVSTFDSGSTFRSYGVDFADREALQKAMPQEHKDFLQQLLWVHEQDGVDTGDPATSYSKLIAVHAGFEAGRSAAEQIQWLRQRIPVKTRIEEISGRHNVYENLPEHNDKNVLVVSGHHGCLDVARRLRLIIDESGGLDQPIAAMILPSRELVRDTDDCKASAAFKL